MPGVLYFISVVLVSFIELDIKAIVQKGRDARDATPVKIVV